MRNTAVLPLAFLSVVALALAAGCANGNVATSGGAPTPQPSPSVACTVPPGETVTMVFPQNGAQQAPNLQGVVIAVSPAPLPTNWYFYSVSNLYGSTYGTSSIGFFQTPAPASTATAAASPTATPTPLPTPSDNPGFANPIYEYASNGIFAVSATPPATQNQITIYLANPNCYPGIPASTFKTATHDIPTPSPTPTST